MPYTAASDNFANVTPDRSGPSVDAILLTSAMVSDTADLATYAKALRIYVPSTASAVTLMVTPLAATNDTIAVPLTVPPGGAYYEAMSIRRIWSTGSANLFATGVQILLLRT
jgi:hypothetical protein